MDRIFHRHVQLPTQLTDIGQAHRQHRRKTDAQLPHLHEREAFMTEIFIGNFFQHPAGKRAAEIDHRL